MDLKKYEIIRNRINNMDFEGKYKNLSNWLHIFSFIGNIGSIFFAYFLIQPALLDSIEMYVGKGYSILISDIITIIILSMLEILKRIIIKNFSFEFIKNKYKIQSISNFIWLFVCANLLTASMYFSINGAIKLSENNKNITHINNNIDEQILLLEKDNEVLIDNRNSLPINHITNKERYQQLIDNNITKIEKLENKKNIKNNSNNTYVFILISTFIEFIIFCGVYFKNYYEYNSYRINENKLEKTLKKRENYLTLLSLIYNNGKNNIGDRVISIAKIKEILKDVKNQNINKLLTIFFIDLENLDIVKTENKRKYINISYDNAIEIIKNNNNNVDIINKLNNNEN